MLRKAGESAYQLSKSGQRRIKGIWYSYYEVSPDGSLPDPPGSALDPVRIERIQFRQIGRIIMGKNVKTSRDYFLKLRLQDTTFLTGTWTDNSEQRYHYGSCQFCFDYSGQYLIGKFLGRDRLNYVKANSTGHRDSRSVDVVSG